MSRSMPRASDVIAILCKMRCRPHGLADSVRHMSLDLSSRKSRPCSFYDRCRKRRPLAAPRRDPRRARMAVAGAGWGGGIWVVDSIEPLALGVMRGSFRWRRWSATRSPSASTGAPMSGCLRRKSRHEPSCCAALAEITPRLVSVLGGGLGAYYPERYPGTLIRRGRSAQAIGHRQ